MSRPRLSQISVRWWLVGILLLAFALRLYRLDAQSLWFDEIVTVAMARASWYHGFIILLGQGMQLTPLYHGIIKLWMVGGNSDWWLRVPSLVIGVMTIPMVFRLGQLYFDDKVALMTAFIFAINPFQVWYSQELKLYTLLPFVSAGAMVAFSFMLKSKGQRGMLPLSLFIMIGVAAHYFMFLISAVQFLVLAFTLKKNHAVLRRWIAAQLIAVVPLLAWWLFILVERRMNIGIGWILPPVWYALLLTFWNFSFMYSSQWTVTAMVALVVLFTGLGLGLKRTWRVPEQGLLFTLWLFFPPLIVMSLSYGRISFYVDRYFMEISPALALLVIAGFFSVRTGWLRWGLLLIFMAATGLGLWRIYFDAENFTKEDWRSIAQTIDQQATPDDVVITCADGQLLSFEYYNPHQHLKPEHITIQEQMAQVAFSKPDASGGPMVWVVISNPGTDRSHHLTKTAPVKRDLMLLSPPAAAWETGHLQQVIAKMGLSAYQYNAVDTTHLAEVVAWYCEND